MSLVLMPSDQHFPHIPDGHTPIMPGQQGYRGYHPNQAQLGQTPDSAGHDHYGLMSNLTTSTPHHEGHAGYQYMGNYAPLIHQSSNSQPFGSSADVNTNLTSTANAYPVADHASAFTPSNRSTNSHTTPTISPSQTQFDANDATQFYEDTDVKGRHDSLYPKEEAASPMTTPPPGRRRPRYQYAEPGSARAIYLEKNRKAASKCRTKQKQEQEQLVETSREAERRNRVLKAELNLLEQERRQWLELANSHMNCPDQRIAIYLQYQADKLGSRRQPGLSQQN
jgi:cyclic AMP-dependent transcription factor ATF-2